MTFDVLNQKPTTIDPSIYRIDSILISSDLCAIFWQFFLSVSFILCASVCQLLQKKNYLKVKAMLFEDIDPNAHIYCNNGFALRTFGCDTVFVFNDALSIFDATEKVKIGLVAEDTN